LEIIKEQNENVTGATVQSRMAGDLLGWHQPKQRTE